MQAVAMGNVQWAMGNGLWPMAMGRELRGMSSVLWAMRLFHSKRSHFRIADFSAEIPNWTIIAPLLRDGGWILWNEDADIVCTQPALVSRVLALFVAPESHIRRLTNATAVEPVVPQAEAVRRLGTLPELAGTSPQERINLLGHLEKFQICFRLNPAEGVSYGGMAGWLFPSMRPSCDVFVLPDDPTLISDHLRKFSST